MADKDIKLKFTTEYDGGAEKPAEDVKGVGDEAKKAGKKLDALNKVTLAPVSEGVSEADERLKELQERIQKTKERAEELTERAEVLQDQFDKTGGEAGNVAEDLKKIKRVQLADAMSKLAGQLRNVGGGLRRAGGDMRVFDEDAGAMLETIGQGAEEIGGFVEAGLQGFAAGGPLGAALGLVVGAFQSVTESIEKAADVSKRVGGQINTDWKLNKESIDKANEVAKEYAEKIKLVSAAHDEELRRLRAKFTLQGKLRAIQLELAGRKTEAEITRIENSDLSEVEKRERIAELRLEQLRKKQAAERKALDEEVRLKEARLETLQKKESEAEARLNAAKEAASLNTPEKAQRAEENLENVLRSLAEESAQLSGKITRGVGWFGNLAGSREEFGEVAKGLEAGEFSGVGPGDLREKKVRENLAYLASQVLEAVDKDRERFAGTRDSVLDDLEVRAKHVMKLTELMEKLEKTATDKAVAAKEAADKLKTAQQEYEKARNNRDTQDDGLQAEIEAARFKRRELPEVQEQEYGATAEQFEMRVRRAEEEAERAKQAAGKSAKKAADGLREVRDAAESASSDIDAESAKALASAKSLDDAADRVGEVVKAVESSEQKQAAANRRLQSAVAKNGEVVTRALTAAAKEQERANRRLEVLEETVRSLA